MSNGVKKHKLKKKKEDIDQAREELKGLEDLPLVGGLFKGLEKFVDLVERVEEAGGEIKRRGEIKGLGGETKGIYGFSIRTAIGQRPEIQTFGNIRPVKKKTGKKEIKMLKNREPMIDVFDEKDHILIVAELPGISEKEIEINLKGDILILETREGERKYYKEILLPFKVNAQTEKRTYKNGVLEIKFRKAKM